MAILFIGIIYERHLSQVSFFVDAHPNECRDEDRYENQAASRCAFVAHLRDCVEIMIPSQLWVADQFEKSEPQLVPHLMRDRKIVQKDRSHILFLCLGLWFYVAMWFKFLSV